MNCFDCIAKFWLNLLLHTVSIGPIYGHCDLPISRIHSSFQFKFCDKITKDIYYVRKILQVFFIIFHAIWYKLETDSDIFKCTTMSSNCVDGADCEGAAGGDAAPGGAEMTASDHGMAPCSTPAHGRPDGIVIRVGVYGFSSFIPQMEWIWRVRLPYPRVKC